ncbi:MAG: cysteine dioxygenase family protein [Bacteroidia bacterium]|nr:cysteine dioxygenase family protein [Bacteroidia bacterium]NNJ56366.1 cysteine dioxygenase family protein [Bacteroidia bacterium]
MENDKTSLVRISSLDDLVNALESGEYSDVIDQFDDLDISKNDLDPYIFWNQDYYTRNCIAKDDFFELIVLCWEKGQKTPIHSHDHQECFVKVLEGNFNETQFIWNESNHSMDQIGSDFISQNEVTAVESESVFHTLENTNRGRSISLHLYMKPIEKCEVYSKTEDRIITRELSYYSHEGVLV